MKAGMIRILFALAGLGLPLALPAIATADPYISMGDSTSTSAIHGEHSSYVDLLYNGYGDYPGFGDVLGADEHLALAQSGQILSGLGTEQLPVALDAIGEADDTKAVTVAIGGNDAIRDCFTFCDNFKVNYFEMVRQLKTSLDEDPGEEYFALMSLYNPYRWAGSGVSQEDQDEADRRLLGANLIADQCPDGSALGLNDIVLQAANAFGVDVADPYPAFLVGGGSFLRDATHANAAGDVTLANAFLDPVPRVDCDPPPDPTCETDPSLCPPEPDPTCETDATVCQKPRGTNAPRTRILKGPVKVGKRSVKFFFKSSAKDSTFRCSLDGRKFRKCGSPKKLKRLKKGRHTFRVRAIDRAGNVDRTPAKRKFRIRRR